MKNIISLFVLSCIVFSSCNKTNTKNCCSGSEQTASVDSCVIAVPDIFTPNGDGVNDVLNVLTKNISSLTFTVKRNRKVLFETSNLSVGWSGTFNGKDSKEKEYSYTVEATTINGQHLSLSGSICIIRDNCSRGELSNCHFGSQFNGTNFDSALPSGETINVCN